MSIHTCTWGHCECVRGRHMCESEMDGTYVIELDPSVERVVPVDTHPLRPVYLHTAHQAPLTFPRPPPAAASASARLATSTSILSSCRQVTGVTCGELRTSRSLKRTKKNRFGPLRHILIRSPSLTNMRDAVTSDVSNRSCTSTTYRHGTSRRHRQGQSMTSQRR